MEKVDDFGRIRSGAVPAVDQFASSVAERSPQVTAREHCRQCTDQSIEVASGNECSAHARLDNFRDRSYVTGDDRQSCCTSLGITQS